MFGVEQMTDRITFGKGLGPVGKSEGPRKTAKSKPGAAKNQTDKVEFSSVLAEVSKSTEASAAASPERAQKLAALKEQIGNGTYRPDPEKVAAGLVDFLQGVK